MNATKASLVSGLFIAALLDCTGRLHAASTIQFSASVYSVVENAGTVSLTVLRTNDSSTVVTVDFSSADGTATNGLKYTAVSGTLTFQAGETRQVIVVPILNEGFVEGTKAFTVSLSNPTMGALLGAPSLATVQIKDNDTGLSFEFSNYWVKEDEGSVLVGVVRGDDGNYPVTVDVTSMDLTAKSGSDYAGITNTLSFASGEKVKLFTVPIFNDGVKKPNRNFRLALSNPSGGAVLGSSARFAAVTIIDNDPGVQFAQNQLWVQEQEGTVSLLVTRGNDQMLDAFTVDYATTNGTALAGSDYTEINGTLAFAAGEMIRSIMVPILDDGVAKKDRRFAVVLSNPTGGMALGAATNATATVTICDVREMQKHRFEVVQASSDGMMNLTLGGGYTPGLGLSNRFQPYFDICPVEVSTNLMDWTPLMWVTRTNASTNALSFAEPRSPGLSPHFYRTPARDFVAPQQPPTGPYPVGRIHRTINDATRRNRYHVSTNGSFPITLWYPARRVPGQWPATYEPELETRDPRVWGDLIDRVPYMSSYSLQDAPFADGVTNLPVVFWSHGYPDYRFDGEELAEHLASQGYVVVGVDHFDCPKPVFPDGRYLYTDPDTTGNNLSVATLQNRAHDLVVVLDELEVWNSQDPLLAARLDVQNVAGIGFSYGGGTVGEFCRVDPRGRVAVILEGYLQNADTLLAVGLAKPVLSIYASDNGGDLDLFNKLMKDAIYFQIRNTEHFSFSKWYWTLTTKTLSQGREAANTIADYTLWFLNKHLKNSADPMPALKDYPRVYNFKQK